MPFLDQAMVEQKLDKRNGGYLVIFLGVLGGKHRWLTITYSHVEMLYALQRLGTIRMRLWLETTNDHGHLQPPE